jgi:alpha-D-xyloside xylohydrolase
MMRPMLLEFPGDRAAATLDRQYTLGDALLVAPVFSAAGDVDYYVPAGTWTHLLTGATVTGPAWVTERCAIDTLPLYVRPGTVLPIGAHDDRPDYDYADGVRLDLYELADGARVVVEVPALGGAVAATFTVTRTADRVLIEAAGAVGPWSARVVRPDATTVHAEPGAARLELTL